MANSYRPKVGAAVHMFSHRAPNAMVVCKEPTNSYTDTEEASAVRFTANIGISSY